ncbi:MAG TPA: sulfotransferase [Gemmatimonadales bacterium]
MIFRFDLAARALGLSLARFRPLHFLFVLGFGVVVAALGLLGLAGMLLDELLQPGYRHARVERPVYIVATPRSGTTWLHRLLCLDPQFTWIKLYETLFPSALLMRLVQAVSRIDRLVGGPLHRSAGWISRKAFAGWEGIHHTGLDRAEEDEMIWLWPLLSPAIVLLFPWPADFPESFFPDRLPPSTRSRLARYYRRFLQRHQHVHGGARTLLAKNALMGGRVETVLEAVPDARFVLLVRDPAEAIPSMLSMFTVPWRAHSPGIRLDGPEVRSFAESAVTYYRRLQELRTELAPERLLAIRYDDLVADPGAQVERIYRHFGIALTEEVREELSAELARSRSHRSGHDYSLEQFGLSPAWVRERLPDVYEEWGFEPAGR